MMALVRLVNTKAEPLLQQVVQEWTKILGTEHPDTGRAVNNLATLYFAIGDYAKAEPLFHQALKTRTNTLGPEHLDTADTPNNLATLLQGDGRLR